MKRLLMTVLAVAICTSLVLTACTKTEQPSNLDDSSESTGVKMSAKDIKVGFIYISPIGDSGWAYAHDQGRKYIENELGVQTIYRESVPENAEIENVVKDMINQGTNVIVGTSFGYMDYIQNLAKQYPNVKFLHCSGNKVEENLGNFYGRIYEGRYLSGIVAGMKTKSNKIGFVAAYEIPEVIMSINSFTLGVRSVNPNAKVYVKYTDTWGDAAKERTAATEFVKQGCDVITQCQDDAEPQIVAQENGVWSIGYNSDMSTKAPKANMTSAIWNWGIYYKEQVQKIMNGTWKAEAYTAGMKEGLVNIAPLTEVAPQDAKIKVDEMSNKIKSGEFNIFSGPIKNKSGVVKVEQGKALTHEEIMSMDWLVEGVEVN